ncbi:uncharacterized protein AKAW2_61230S [Aspergillus luchuensis]|uniref:Uncharacterized protein n=1 Tax=Aspergillus kawachii TaxID=1069201 RepID=A0A7R8A285_ASPKA|nr:uncharacterized protein AKAW2_61230S [Aspergillus luchuensis]BCS02966.1 hypothetical protein AKAW2_61230S [Aspergillus luchuensis]
MLCFSPNSGMVPATTDTQPDNSSRKEQRRARVSQPVGHSGYLSAHPHPHHAVYSPSPAHIHVHADFVPACTLEIYSAIRGRESETGSVRNQVGLFQAKV